jgi:hypothetical protein
LSWRTYLLDLTTQRAFKVFVAFLLAGTISIVSNKGLPWVPALAVLLYGGLLLYCAHKYKISFSETTNNSPYFLGFVFFLLSLFRTFYSSSIQDSNSVDSIIRQLGSALLSIVVGEFVNAKRTVFAEEQMAARHYIRSLTKATAMFDGSIESLPTTLTTAIDLCLTRFKELEGHLQSFSEVTSSLDSAPLKQAVDGFQSIGITLKALEGSLTSLEVSLSETAKVAGGLPESVKNQIASVNEELALVPASVKEQIGKLSQELALIPQAGRDQISRIEGDINAIDKLLDTFVELLRAKVEVFK